MDWRCGRTGQVTSPVPDPDTLDIRTIADTLDLSITSEIAAAEHRRATHVATKKAENLLLSALCEEQRKDLKKWGYFKLYVKAKDGGQRVYRIRRGQIRNIDLVEEIDGVLRPVKTLCAHPEIQVPDADAMLAQKLMLETDEEAFLKIANHMRPVAEALELFRPPGMLVAEEREREECMRQADEEFHASLWAARNRVADEVQFQSQLDQSA